MRGWIVDRSPLQAKSTARRTTSILGYRCCYWIHFRRWTGCTTLKGRLRAIARWGTMKAISDPRRTRRRRCWKPRTESLVVLLRLLVMMNMSRGRKSLRCRRVRGETTVGRGRRRRGRTLTIWLWRKRRHGIHERSYSSPARRMRIRHRLTNSPQRSRASRARGQNPPLTYPVVIYKPSLNPSSITFYSFRETDLGAARDSAQFDGATELARAAKSSVTLIPSMPGSLDPLISTLSSTKPHQPPSHHAAGNRMMAQHQSTVGPIQFAV